MRDPLLAPLAAIATGILVSRFVPFEVRELLTVIAIFLILGIVAAVRTSRVLAGACCLLGLLFAGVLTDVAHRPGPPPELDNEGPVILAGCVVEPPAVSGDRQRFILELEREARAQVTVYLRDGETPPRLTYGQRVELDAKVRCPHNFGNPGAFDYVRYLARKDVYWTASVNSGASIRILPGQCGSAFQRAVMAIRSSALDRIKRLYRGDPYETGMMQAILFGQSFQLEKVWTEQFRSTGTFHALVISGLHVAVLAAFFLFLLRICFVPRGLAMLLTVLAAWLYALITGWHAPVIRATAGLTLFMIGGHFHRKRRIMNLLAAIAFGFLVLDPEQLFEPSFQLSFLAVGFIAAFALPLLERTSAPLVHALSDLLDTGRDLHLPPRSAQFRVELRLLAESIRLWTHCSEQVSAWIVTLPSRGVFYVFELILLSAVVQMGLALPMVVYFHRLGFSGLSANAVVVPLIGLIVPIGFVAVVSGWTWVARIAGWLLGWIRVAVDWHAHLEPNWRIPTPPWWLAVGVAAGFFAVAVSRGLGRRISLLVLSAALVLLIWHPFPPSVEPNRLEVTAIDVGQGESLFAAFPNGKLMVIDGGGIPAFGRRTRPQLDIGEDVVSPYLWQRSVRHIDVLVLTHAHEDHIGGMGALLENFHVKELWTGATPESREWISLRAKARKEGVKIVPLRRGTRFAFGGAQVQVLSPSPDYVPTETPRNNDSLTLRLTFGRNSFLLCGDIERQVEEDLLAEGLVGKTDVLKVAHHGSKTSSTEPLLDAVRPAFALISAGFGNSYGNPNPGIVARLVKRRAMVLRTDLDGLVSVSSDGYRLKVETARWIGTSAGLYRFF